MACPSKKKLKSYSEEELRVAEILLQIHGSFQKSTSRSLHFFRWGSKKKRSSLVSSSSTSFDVVAKEDAASPATPLSFSPSDVDSKFNRPKRVVIRRRRPFKKKNNEQLREVVAALTSQQEQLKHDISKVKGYYEEMRAVNLQLKARQSELFLRRKFNQLDLKSCKSLKNVYEKQTEQVYPVFEKKNQAPIGHQPSEPSAEQHQALIILQQSAVNEAKIVGNFRYPEFKISLLSDSRLSLQSNHPHPVLASNLYADEDARSDFHCKAATAAQARKRRIEIIRVKNSMASKQSRLI